MLNTKRDSCAYITSPMSRKMEKTQIVGIWVTKIKIKNIYLIVYFIKIITSWNTMRLGTLYKAKLIEQQYYNLNMKKYAMALKLFNIPSNMLFLAITLQYYISNNTHYNISKFLNESVRFLSWVSFTLKVIKKSLKKN